MINTHKNERITIMIILITILKDYHEGFMIINSIKDSSPSIFARVEPAHHWASRISSCSTIRCALASIDSSLGFAITDPDYLSTHSDVSSIQIDDSMSMPWSAWEHRNSRKASARYPKDSKPSG